jgi:hypothetical protein
VCVCRSLNEMGGACSAYGEGRDVYGNLVGKTAGNGALGRTKLRLVDNIKNDHQEFEFWGCKLDRSDSG